MIYQDKLNLIRNFVQTNFIVILASLLIFSSIANIIFYHKISSLKNNPQQAIEEQTERLIKKVSKLINLPPNEQPTIATVSDPEQLKGQPFFANAKKGDKVLIYANAGKSILYDPVANKVLEVASMNIGANPTPPLAGESSPTPTPKKQ